MFSQESKLAVLESKLSMYEDLSREMLAKLESAVDKISEGNSRIATILAKHDEKIEQGVKTDEIIVRMIDDLKVENREDHKTVMSRIESLEKVVEELKKFRWQFVAIMSAVIMIIGIFPTVKTIFIPENVVIEEVRK